MSVTSFIERCVEAGMPIDMALKAAKAFEAEVNVMDDLRRSKDRERQARHRAGKGRPSREVTQRHVTPVTDVTDVTSPSVSPEPPSTPSQVTPLSVPLKGDSFPPNFDRAWKAYPEAGRKRSSTKLSKPEWSRASKAAGGVEALQGAIERYADSPEAREQGGRFVKGFHRWLKDALFEPWLAPVADPAKPPEPPDDPWPRRLREFRVNGYWNTTDWGPKPGKPGYRGPELQEAA
jgi:hypothetical protein